HRGVLLRILFLFFFSSRRRHTRLQGDWSSDVCSSDLDVGRHPDELLWRAAGGRQDRKHVLDRQGRLRIEPAIGRDRAVGPDRQRSEERRVGKEWRWRGWPEQ